MTPEFYKNVHQNIHLPNDFRIRILGNKKVLGKFQIEWKHLVSLLEINFW